MAKELYLYTGYTPNLGQGEHLLVNNFAGLVTEMAAYRQQTVQLDNYRINSGIAQVKPTSTMKDYLTMSYAIEYDTVAKYGRAYFIKAAQPRESWIDYELELDHWGTFMHDASIQDLIIRRTNRNIGAGIYDRIDATKNRSEEYLENTTLGTGDVTVVFAVEETVKTSALSVLTAQSTSCTKLYSISMATQPLDQPYENIKGLVDLIQNIFQRDVSGWDPQLKVLKAWLLPTNVVNTKNVAASMKYISTSTGSEMTTTTVKEVIPGNIKKTFSVTTSPNYKYFFGTTMSGLEMTNLTEAQTGTVEYIFSSDDVKVYAYIGEHTQDITDAFSIGITTNNGDATGLTEITSALTTIGSGAMAAAAAAGAIAPGVGLLAGYAALGSAAGTVSQMAQVTHGTYIPGGNGWTTWFLTSTDGYFTKTLKTCYRVVKCQSIHDENAHARIKGAVFNIPYSSLTALKSLTLLGTGSATDDTYVEADCDVMNIQADAAAVIRDKLHNGIYLWDRTT